MVTPSMFPEISRGQLSFSDTPNNMMNWEITTVIEQAHMRRSSTQGI